MERADAEIAAGRPRGWLHGLPQAPKDLTATRDLPTTKGFRGLDAQLKADTMHTLWVPGVNAIGTFGKWTFAEFREVFAIQEEFGRLVETLTNKEVA